MIRGTPLLGQVREPPIVTKALGTIHAGVKAALQRSTSSSSSSSSSSPGRDLFGPGKAAAVAFPPISPRDLLEGTCLRFDKTHDRGVLGLEELRQVHMRAADVNSSVFFRSVAWFSLAVFGWRPKLCPGK